MQRLKDELLPSALLHLMVHVIPLTMVSGLILVILGIPDIFMIILVGIILSGLTLLLEVVGGHLLVTSLFNMRWISNEKDAVIYSMVNGLAKKKEVEIGKIGIIELDTPNAFVVSSFRGKPSILFTKGLIYSLSFSELQAVTYYLLGCAQHQLLPIVTMLSGLQSIGSRISMEYIDSQVKKKKASLMKTVLAGWGYMLFSAFNTQTVKSGKLMVHDVDEKTLEMMDNPTALITALVKVSYLLNMQQESFMRTGLISLKALMFQDPSIAVQEKTKLREIANHYNIKLEKLLDNTPITAQDYAINKLHLFEKYWIHKDIEKRLTSILETSIQKKLAIIFGFNKIA